jgi:glycosyltransferase involved in cell wall biosynthesis
LPLLALPRPVNDDRVPVLVAAPPMHCGGTERHLLYLLPELAARGFDITVALLAPGGELEPALRDLPVRVVAPGRALHRPLGALAMADLLRREIAARRPRVLHAFLSEPYLAAAMARLLVRRNRPALVCGRRSMAFYAAHHPVAAFAERLTHRTAAVLVGNSGAVSAELSAEAAGRAPVATIHNGIPLPPLTGPGMRSQARAALGLRDDALVLANVAHLAFYKGHADLLHALAGIRHDLPPGWRLLVAGRDRGERDRLVSLAHALGLQGHVMFLGALPDPSDVFRAADMAVLPSHTEGFSNSLIEGMATGLASIATDAGGNPDAITDGVNGLIVPARAPAELAAAILRLARDPALRRRLGERAAMAMMARHSIAACANAYETLWRGLAYGRPGEPAQWLAERSLPTSAAQAGALAPAALAS